MSTPSTSAAAAPVAPASSAAGGPADAASRAAAAPAAIHAPEPAAEPAPDPVPASAAAAPAPAPAPAAAPPVTVEANAPAASFSQALLGWFSGMSLGGLSLRGAALALAGGLAGSAITLGAVWLATPATRQVATIDLQGVIELQQLKLTAMVLKAGATDDDRARAFTQVKAFGGALDEAIEQVRKSCNCVLLTRNAVVGAHGLDMTPKLRSALGLDGADAEAWRRIASEGIGRALPTAESTRANLLPALGAEPGMRK